MGGQSSKRDKGRQLQRGDRSSHRKKYLPQTNGSSPAVNGGNGNGGEAGQAGACIEEEAVEELPPFTERQKELVTATWRLVQEDMAKVGVVMFIK